MTRPSLKRRGPQKAVRFSRLSVLLILALLLLLTVLCLLQQLIYHSREGGDFSFVNYYYPDEPTPQSALVSLASKPENETKFKPGVHKYGVDTKNALIVVGASITSEYHSPDKLWLQVFALGDKLFDIKAKKCDLVPDHGGSNVTDSDSVLKPWKQMEDELFYCKVGTTKARMMLMPSTGWDQNTNNVLQIWRCPVTLSSYDSARFRQHPSEDVALSVKILHQPSLQDDVTEMMKLYLPSIDPTVGIPRLVSHSPKPLLQQRHNVTLCVVAHSNGLANLNEFIRYHHDIIGIDHFHIGVHVQHGGKENMAIANIASRLLKPDIDAGRVSISANWDTESIGIQCGTIQHYPKMIFYQQCLYRAKSTSEFVATWDLDEYMIFKDDTDKAKIQYLPTFLRGIDHPKCQDWCFVTMESSLAGGGDIRQLDKTGMVALDFPLRENRTERIWQKSIGRTKNVFQNSFHVPGPCLPQGKTNVLDAVAMRPKDGGCAFYIDEAQMVHMRGIQNRGRQQLKGEIVPNELQVLLGNG